MSLFGNIQRTFVDIKNLEKVDRTYTMSQLMFEQQNHDQDMIWRDAKSLEVFVFDKHGHWNKDTLEHPLLN